MRCSRPVCDEKHTCEFTLRRRLTSRTRTCSRNRIRTPKSLQFSGKKSEVIALDRLYYRPYVYLRRNAPGTFSSERGHQTRVVLVLRNKFIDETYDIITARARPFPIFPNCLLRSWEGSRGVKKHWSFVRTAVGIEIVFVFTRRKLRGFECTRNRIPSD